MYKSIHVVANPASGQPEPVLHMLNSVFHAAAVDWDISITKSSGDAGRQALQAATEGADLVAVYGGDGTVMEVASALAGSGTAIAILPGGTANVVSVELGIPKTLAEAAQLTVQNSHTTRAIDIGACGQRRFLHRVGIGLAADKVKGATRELKDRFGAFAYSISALQSVKNPTQASYHMTLDGRQINAQGITCIIANSGNMGVPGLKLAKNVSVSDGLLDVFMIKDRGFFSIFSSAASIIDVTPKSDSFHHWQAKEIRIETDPPMETQGDGEMWEQTPIQLSVIPSAVRVLVPAA
ncbi:MAG: diacylglycerol kinase family lipid kinase [Chloroflexi bacterium]|nr:diacylglycerol kinase family lipid kinase [Chloroflexota bacterium]